MQRVYTAIVIGLAVFVLSGCQHTRLQQPNASGNEPGASVAPFMGTLKLTSPQFKHGGAIPAKSTCDGVDINPPLAIEGIPEGAASLALIMDDPDAPVGTWDHWIVWNIKRNTKYIFENSIPLYAVQGKNDFKRVEYGGPCPPSGVHRYQFKLYALDTMLDLPSQAGKKGLEAAMKGHILEEALLVGTYSRQ